MAAMWVDEAAKPEPNLHAISSPSFPLRLAASTGDRHAALFSLICDDSSTRTSHRHPPFHLSEEVHSWDY